MSVLKKESIVMNLPSEGHEEAIRRSGKLLVEGGYVQENYINGMLERDRSLTTAIGNYLAIPHGEKEYKQDIIRTGIVVTAYPEGIDWNGNRVHLVIGIAANGDEHLKILENIADKLENEEDVLDIVQYSSEDEVLYMLSQ